MPERKEFSQKQSARLDRDKRLTLPQRFIPLKSRLQPYDQRDFDIAFFEQVIASDPCHEDALLFLGTAYTERGDNEKGFQMDMRLVRLRPQDPVAHYNLACSYSLLSQLDQAFDALTEAICCGYRDLDHLESDPDLAGVRADPRYRELREMLAQR